jgi:hypothetical protein
VTLTATASAVRLIRLRISEARFMRRAMAGRAESTGEVCDQGKVSPG